MQRWSPRLLTTRAVCSWLTNIDHPNPSQPLYLINRKDSPAYVYQWHSNNPAVAAVSANGVVTAQSEGEAVITALTSLGQSLTCKVRWPQMWGRWC